MSERSGVRSPAAAWVFCFAASSWLFFFAIVSTFCAIYLAPYIPFYSYSRELERRGLFHSYFMLPHRESRRGESKEFRESLAMDNLWPGAVDIVCYRLLCNIIFVRGVEISLGLPPALVLRRLRRGNAVCAFRKCLHSLQL